MKKPSYVLVISLVCFIGFVVMTLGIINNNTGILNKTYATPEEVIEKSWTIKSTKILNKLVSDGAGIVFYQHKSSLNREFVYYTEKGWKHIPLGAMKLKKQQQTQDFILLYRTYKDKHLIYISTLGREQIETPKDNFSSEFQYINLIFEDYSSHEWFLTLDELPENYVITINGEDIPLN